MEDSHENLNSFTDQMMPSRGPLQYQLSRMQLLGSRDFWLCNLIGWLIYIFLNSVLMRYYDVDVYAGIQVSAETAIYGTFTLLAFRAIYIKCNWRKNHPLVYFPYAVLGAIVFATLRTAFNCASDGMLNLIIQMFSSPREHPHFGAIVGMFIAMGFLMLGWLMLYLFIQSDRKQIETKLSAHTILVSLFVLYSFLELFQAVTTFAYYPVDGVIFSPEYMLFNLFTLVMTFVLSSYVLVLRPSESILKSRFLPQLPLFTTLAFCNSLFSILIFNTAPHIHNVIEQDGLANKVIVFYRVLIGHSEIWGNPLAIMGMAQIRFYTQLIVSLYLLMICYTTHWKLKPQSITIPLDFKKSLQFWSFNILGWVNITMLLYLFDFFDFISSAKEIETFYLGMLIVTGSIFGSIFRNSIKHYQLVNKPLIIFVYITAITSITLGVFMTSTLAFGVYICLTLMDYHFSIPYLNTFLLDALFFYKSVAIYSASFMIWSLIYELSVSQRNKIFNKLKDYQLKNSIKEAQLHALLLKIDPHFIFNSLNNIDALIKEDASKARQSLKNLSDLLRIPISHSSAKTITIKRELNFVQNYVKLSQIQFENRLQYEESIDASLLNASIPPMMIQIMVENAIKHGVARNPMGGRIKVQILRKADTVVCFVFNTTNTDFFASQPGLGVGLNNIKERLQLIYGEHANFTLRIETHMTVAKLKFPLEFNHEGHNR